MNIPFIEYPKAKKVVVSGDIHGDYKQLIHKCCVLYGMTDTLIIVAGDCGFGFERPGYYENIYKHCSKLLQKANNWVVFIRGNHDNPAYFEGKQVNYKRWKAVPDYTVIKACRHTILCVGGAISVDRMLRMCDNCQIKSDDPLSPNIYWSNELPMYDKTKLDDINDKCAIDVVITHTSPSFCEKSSHQGLESWAAHDNTLLADVHKERETIDYILNYLVEHNHPITWWYYGHYHQSWHCEIEDIRYHMLDIMELSEIQDV